MLYVTLTYSVAGQPINDCIRIERTSCNYGGTRPWSNARAATTERLTFPRKPDSFELEVGRFFGLP